MHVAWVSWVSFVVQRLSSDESLVWWKRDVLLVSEARDTSLSAPIDRWNDFWHLIIAPRLASLPVTCFTALRSAHHARDPIRGKEPQAWCFFVPFCGWRYLFGQQQKRVARWLSSLWRWLLLVSSAFL